MTFAVLILAVFWLAYSNGANDNFKGVAVLPGSEFGRSPEELSARIAYVDFDGDKALSAASECPPGQPLDDSFARRHCSRVVEAVERICRWLQAE